jgi:hypothetical protein
LNYCYVVTVEIDRRQTFSTLSGGLPTFTDPEANGYLAPIPDLPAPGTGVAGLKRSYEFCSAMAHRDPEATEAEPGMPDAAAGVTPF